MSNVKVIHDTKFKNIFISVRFLSDLKQESVLAKYILANILNESCKKYPTKQSVTDLLDQMYGAVYNASSNIVGSAQVMACKSKVIHPTFIQNKMDLLEEQFKLLNAFLFHPLLDDKGFDEHVFEESKRNLIDMIARTNDDPSSYCMYQAMRIAGATQPLGWGVFGDAKDVEKISMQEVVNIYHQMMKENRVDILVLGDVEEDVVQELVAKYLPFESNHKEILPVSYHFNDSIEDKEQFAYKDISQSYITNLYTSKVNNQDEDFATIRIANAILGQLPTSLLFQEVREKHSLCYSIYSALFPYDGVLGISTGVEMSNVDKAKTLISEQIDRMKKGDFEDEMITVAKKMIVNSLKSTGDDADSIFALAYRNILFKREDSVSSLIQEIQKVNKEDVVKVMNKVELCLSYVVKAREEA